MMKWCVEVSDYTEGHNGRHWKQRAVIGGLTIRKAWRLAHRGARRGVKMYGGCVVINNWGARGGRFPLSYRSVTIKFDDYRHH